MKLRMALALAAVVAVSLLSGGTAMADSACPTGPRLAPIIYRGANLPPPSQSKPVPLIIGLHGSSSSPAFFERNSGLDRIADAHGAVIAYLGSQTPTASSWTRCDLQANLAYISSEISQLIPSENIDPSRVYVTGFSAGATMSFFVGCALSGQVAAIAPVSGWMAYSQPCQLARPESMMLIIGTNDGAGVNGNRVLMPVTSLVQRWQGLDGCSSAPSLNTTYFTVQQQAWTACNDQSALATDVIQGGTHTWPPDVGADRYLNAANAIWAFLSAHPAMSASKPSESVRSNQVRHLKQAHHRLKRWLRIALTSSENNLTVRITFSWHGMKVISKVAVLGRGYHVISLPIRQTARGARYTLMVSFSDGYGRTSTLKRTLGVPKPTY